MTGERSNEHRHHWRGGYLMGGREYCACGQDLGPSPAGERSNEDHLQRRLLAVTLERDEFRARAAALQTAIEATVNYCNEADAEASRGKIGRVILSWAGTVRYLLATSSSSTPEQPQTLQAALGCTDEQMAEQREHLSATFDRIREAERQASIDLTKLIDPELAHGWESSEREMRELRADLAAEAGPDVAGGDR